MCAGVRVCVCVAAQNPLKCVFQLKKFLHLKIFKHVRKSFMRMPFGNGKANSQRDTAKQKENPYPSPCHARTQHSTATETESATESAASNICPATKPNEK